MAADTADESIAAEAIAQQKAVQGTDKDVEELFLVRLKLSTIPHLDKFRNLKVLRLNGNRIHNADFLRSCQRLTELYLQDNQLPCIDGVIGHLTSLTILSLQRNQLTRLERVIAEIRRLRHLQRLNLSENPVAQENDYRHFVVFHCPSVTLLDRQEVTLLQRRTARRIYDQEQELVRDRVAFGRRSEGPPSICYPSQPVQESVTVPVQCVGDNFLRDNPLYTSLDAAAEARRLNKSLVEFTRFDWTKIPRYEKRRTQPDCEVRPELVTLRLKI